MGVTFAGISMPLMGEVFVCAFSIDLPSFAYCQGESLVREHNPT